MQDSCAIDDLMIGQVFSVGSEIQRRHYVLTLQQRTFALLSPLLGAAALEARVKNSPSPRVLHLATHGFAWDYEPAEGERLGPPPPLAVPGSNRPQPSRLLSPSCGPDSPLPASTPG